jgi:hypothetical protein
MAFKQNIFKKGTAKSGWAHCYVCGEKIIKRDRIIILNELWQLHTRCCAKELMKICLREDMDIDELKKEVLVDTL